MRRAWRDLKRTRRNSEREVGGGNAPVLHPLTASRRGRGGGQRSRPSLGGLPSGRGSTSTSPSPQRRSRATRRSIVGRARGLALLASFVSPAALLTIFFSLLSSATFAGGGASLFLLLFGPGPLSRLSQWHGRFFFSTSSRALALSSELGVPSLCRDEPRSDLRFSARSASCNQSVNRGLAHRGAIETGRHDSRPRNVEATRRWAALDTASVPRPSPRASCGERPPWWRPSFDGRP